MTQPRKGLRSRGQRPAANDSSGGVLDHEHCFPTVNIEANVVGSHRAVLPVRRRIGAPYGMTPWRLFSPKLGKRVRISSATGILNLSGFRGVATKVVRVPCP